MDRNLNLSGFHSDKYWTNGDAAIKGLSIDMRSGRAGVVTIEMKGWRPDEVMLKKDKVSVYINGTQLELKKMTRKDNRIQHTGNHRIHKRNTYRFVDLCPCRSWHQ